MPEAKLARVVGMGSSLPLVLDDPYNPSNRRISILVMTHESEERLLGKKTIPLGTDDGAASQAEGIR
jgi:chemotaxis protein MotB